MSKSTKINDFRTLNLSEKPTPTKKSVGAVSKSSKKVTKKKKVLAEKKVREPLKSSRKKEEKKSNIGLVIFFMLLVFSGAFIGCLFTPTFNIDVINVQEGTKVDKAQILSKMNNVIGENILRVSTSSLEEVLEELSYIRSVEVERVFPNELKVTFKERQPYALIKYLESFVVMDKYGHVLEIKKENDMPELAIIYGIDAEKFVVGEQLEDVSGLKYENITYLLETSYKNQFDYTIYEINYTDTEQLIMAVKEMDVDINFGEIDRNILTEKMNYLKGVLKKLAGKKGNLDISSNNYLEKTIFTERY